MKIGIFAAWFAGLISIFLTMPAPSAIVPSPSDIDTRIRALMARMTLLEKLGQLQILSGASDGSYSPDDAALIRAGRLGAMFNVRGARRTNELQRVAVEQSRLGIPLLFAFDVIHGYRTIFPIPLAEAATWDPEAVERAASIAAAESAASGVRWTFAPMVDVARDARWGRIAESAGEDPLLGAVLARARVRGFQGLDLSDPTRIVACAKHWVAYGAAESGRDYNTTDVSEWTLREVYFPPFKAAVDAGVGTIMSAFNDLNGVPATANPFTLSHVLRREWKFDGIVVSDYESVSELRHHGVAGTDADAARQALTAGVDIEMVSRLYSAHVPWLLRQGHVSMRTIDGAVSRVLRIKFRLGLFDRPYTDESRAASVLSHPQHLAAARDVAARSLVLLKNEGNLLPLSKGIRSLAVIGALADSKLDMLGSWSADGRAGEAVTLLEGIRAKVSPATTVGYAKGCGITGDCGTDLTEAVRIAALADAVVLAVGESAEMSGEARSRTSLDLAGRQLDLVQAVHATGKPLIVVLMNGRPLSINWVVDRVPAIVEAWFAGSQGGHAIADVLFGDVNPGGKLPVTIPRTVGQVPLYYNHKNTGRPPDPARGSPSEYVDAPRTPLFPFGFGLSYTQFRFSNLQVNAPRLRRNRHLHVAVDVENVGRRVGDEVVQLYIRDLIGSRTRPVKELKGFQRVRLEPGERRRVEFTLTPAHLGFYDRRMRFVVEAGTFKVWLGSDSMSGLEATFEVVNR